MVGTSAEKIRLSAHIKQDLLAATRTQRNLILAETIPEMKIYAAQIDELAETMTHRSVKLHELADPQARSNLEDYLQTWSRWLEVDSEVRQLTQLNSNVRAKQLSSGTARSAFSALEHSLNRVLTRIRDEFEEASRRKQPEALTLAGRKLRIATELLQIIVGYQHGEKEIFLTVSSEQTASLSDSMDLLSSQVELGFAALHELLDEPSKRQLELSRRAYGEYGAAR